MKALKTVNNKKGSYLVEASFTLPIFILGVAALAMIVNMIAVCESICFVMSREVKEILLFDISKIQVITLCKTIEDGVEDEHPSAVGVKVRSARCGVNQYGMTDLITVSAKADFNLVLPAGMGGKASFNQKLMARQFSGSLQDENELEAAAFTQGAKSAAVIVYPRYGERYHNQRCEIVSQQLEHGNNGWEMDLKEAQLRNFTPCEICGGT